MNRFIYIISIIFTLSLIAACSKSNDSIAFLPLYQSCANSLPLYEKKLRGLGYEVSFTEDRFAHFGLEAHPGLVGAIHISGPLSDQELSDILSGLKVICFPGDYVKIESSVLGLQELLRVVDTKNKLEKYLVYDGGYFWMYFNNSTDAQRALILN